MARRQISPERKGIYYLGMFLGVVGLLSFLSVFISGAMHFGDFSNFVERGRSMMLRAVVGMGMMMAGAILANLGRMGAAGSGIVLDPERARRDVEPWSRMAGGVVKDALDEAGIPAGKGHQNGLPFDEQLRRLHKLHEDKIISDSEFEAKKKRILENS